MCWMPAGAMPWRGLMPFPVARGLPVSCRCPHGRGRSGARRPGGLRGACRGGVWSRRPWLLCCWLPGGRCWWAPARLLRCRRWHCQRPGWFDQRQRYCSACLPGSAQNCHRGRAGGAGRAGPRRGAGVLAPGGRPVLLSEPDLMPGRYPRAPVALARRAKPQLPADPLSFSAFARIRWGHAGCVVWRRLRRQMAGEPVDGQLGDLLQGSWFLEQVGGAGDDRQPALAGELLPGVPVEVEDGFIVAADDGRVGACTAASCGRPGRAARRGRRSPRPAPVGRRQPTAPRPRRCSRRSRRPGDRGRRDARRSHPVRPVSRAASSRTSKTLARLSSSSGVSRSARSVPRPGLVEGGSDEPVAGAAPAAAAAMREDDHSSGPVRDCGARPAGHQRSPR